MRRVPWQILAGALLLVLIAVLATLQYRWLGQVSDAEREQMRASMRVRAATFSQDFDREVTRAYTAFSLDARTFDPDPAGALSDASARGRSQSVVGGIVRDVYVLNRRGAAAGSLERLDPEARTLVAADWPKSFDELHRRLEREHFFVTGFGGRPPVVIRGNIDPGALALIVPVVQTPAVTESLSLMPVAQRTAPTIRLELDRDRVTHTLIES